MFHWIRVGLVTGLVLSSLLFVSAAFAEDAPTLSMGEPEHRGKGCPEGRMSVTISPDYQTLSLIFDEYFLEVGGPSSKKTDRKACHIKIPVEVPQGFSVAVARTDYRGFNSLPEGAMSIFTENSGFGRQFSLDRVESKEVFTGPIDENFTHSKSRDHLIWSPCGGKVNLRIRNSITVKTNRAREQAYASVDSLDVTAGLKSNIHLVWRKCRK